MLNKSDYENSIQQGLILKASEVKPSDEMLSRIINRIKDYEGGKKNMLKDKIQYIFIKKAVAVSLCAVLVLGGIMFTFSDEVRAATLDAIKTIFVLDKIDKGYAIVEKTTEDILFTPVSSRTSQLSDKELTEKLGFGVHFPKTLYGGYEFYHKTEEVGIRKQVSEETSKQLTWDMINAIADETLYNSLSEYNPYRGVFGTYINQEGSTIFINMRSSDASAVSEDAVSIVETSVGNAKADWIEVAYPDYRYVNDNGVGRSDLSTKPSEIIQKHQLTWEANGVRYNLNTYKALELTMEEAVKIAESFME